MIQRAIECVAAMARRAAAVEVLFPFTEDQRRYLLVDRLTNVTTEGRLAGVPRHLIASDLDSFVAMVERCRMDGAVFVGPPDDLGSAVIGVFGLADLRDRVVWRLTFSRPMRWLRSAADGAYGDHRAFVRALRLGTFGEVPDNFTALMRSLKFTSIKNGASEAIVGDESLSREVRERVYGATGQLPEWVDVRVAPFVDLVDEKWVPPVRCLLDFESDTGRMRLVPGTGEVERVLHETLVELAGTLQAQLGEMPVFLGAPEQAEQAE